ncbi:MAG: hypothetical protein QXS37_05975 [Candidatus Aenigmatarchaeota archaeon]
MVEKARKIGKLALKFEDVILYVNPYNVVVQKQAQVSEIRTFAGTVYQHWPDLPDVLTIKGVAFGQDSFESLDYLKKAFHDRKKKVSLEYKGKVYEGFFRRFEITADAEKPGIFHYSFEFVLKGDEPFFEIVKFQEGLDQLFTDEVSSIDSLINSLKNINLKFK